MDLGFGLGLGVPANPNRRHERVRSPVGLDCAGRLRRRRTTKAEEGL